MPSKEELKLKRIKRRSREAKELTTKKYQQRVIPNKKKKRKEQDGTEWE